MNFKAICITALSCLLLSSPWMIGADTAPDEKTKAFDALVAKIQKDNGGATNDEVIQMLALSKELGRPYPASLAVKAYMKRTLNPDPAVLLAGTDCTVLAGDFRAAAARYKIFLKGAQPNPQSSAAAAALFDLYLNKLGSVEDAYDAMARFGSIFRQNADERKFDGWFIETAAARNNYAGIADRLSVIMSEQLPLEMERLMYWDRLDWLMTFITRADGSAPQSLPYCKKIIPLIRENRFRTLRYGYYVANLEYRCTPYKDPAAAAAAYPAVIAAAKAYFDAYPNARALQDFIDTAFGGFQNADGNYWNSNLKANQDFYAYAFAKLPDPVKPSMMNYRGWGGALLTPDQWTALGAQFPEVFKNSPETANLIFLNNTNNPEIYKKQITFLNGVPSGQAAVANSLAQGGDLWADLQYMIQNETWYFGNFGDASSLLMNNLWPYYSSFPRAENAALKQDYWPKLYLRFGAEIATKSPLAIDGETAKTYLMTAWNTSGADPGDKSHFAEHLHALDWVPWPDASRKAVFQPTYDEFKKWTEAVRNNAAAAQKAVEAATAAAGAAGKAVEAATKARDAAPAPEKPAKEQDLAAKTADQKAKTDAVTAAQAALTAMQPQIAQITTIGDAFKQTMDATKVDINKAPSPLCLKLAQAWIALQTKNQAEYLKIARELYPQVRDWDRKKTPFGAAVLGFLIANRGEFDTFDFQLEVMADQVAQYQLNQPNRAYDQVITAMFLNRQGWGWHQFPGQDRAKALKISAIYAKAVKESIAKNQYNAAFYEYFRGTRHGNGWQEQGFEADVLAQIIEKRIPFHNYPHWSSVCDYMWHIRGEFQALMAKYPPETYFDQMFVDEGVKEGVFDFTYFSYGRDEKRIVTDAAAKQFATFDRLPLGYEEGKPAIYGRDMFFQWTSRVLGAAQPLRDAVIATAEGAWGKTRYDGYAMGLSYFYVFANGQTPESRQQFFQHLAAYVEKGKSIPGYQYPPPMGALTQLDPKVPLTDAELQILIDTLDFFKPAVWPQNFNFESLAANVQQGLVARKRFGELYRFAPVFWKMARDTQNVGFQRMVGQWTRDLLSSNQYELATVYSAAATEVFGNGLADDVRTTLMAVRSKAMVEVGGLIPVDHADPRYPIFAAQASYAAGKFPAAWETYSNPNVRDMALVAYKDLDPTFIIWLIDQNTDTRNFDAAEALSRAMITWFDSAPESFDPEVRSAVLLSYADIPFARQEYPKARAQYERIAAAAEFEGTRSKREAQLKIAEVDRVTKQFDRAIDLLNKLVRSEDKYLQTEGNYQLALVKYDQTDYTESLKYLEQVFSLVPDHDNGRILQGKLNLTLKKLAEATSVQVGLSASKRFIVPGSPLKVSLEDRNLAVVGASTNVEVRVWTSSGDEETFNLFPFGDSKTKFEGQIPTEMNAAKKGDHILQLLGNDTVSYDYSDKFLKKGASATDAPNTLTVGTDAQLMVSSGKILSKEEQENRSLELLIRQKLSMEEAQQQQSLSTIRAEDQIKPGNKINIRVIDPDHDISNEKDKLTVSLTTSSGDSIPAYALEETGPHTGVFEGIVSTSSGQATAYASDSEDGREPNFAISSQEYPAWSGLPDNSRPKSFSVDLNDNVALGTMNILANVPGRKLKDFFVQTSFNGRDFRSVACWPVPLEKWDGSPRIELIKAVNFDVGGAGLPAFQAYFDKQYLQFGVPKIIAKTPTMSAKWDPNIGGSAGPMTMGTVTDWYVARFSANFYLPRAQTRTFKIDPKGNMTNMRYLLVVDGKVEPAADDALKTKRQFLKGLHTINVYLVAHRPTSNPNFELLCDIPTPPFIGPCPPEMFDPGKESEIKKAFDYELAKLTPAADGSSFDVAFAPGTKARVVRLLIADYETDAPAINKIKLTDTAGKVVLPTQQDFMSLKKNDSLEIVPGDRISITYKDSRVISKDKQTLESAMTATYTNGEISAAFVNFRTGGMGDRIPLYTAMRRYKAGDAIKVLIRDPDADVSDELDTVKFTAKAGDGKAVELDALETEKHSGAFVGSVFPVAGAPQRPSEIQVQPGQQVTLSYLDKENLDPGIPWERTCDVEQAIQKDPELRVYDETTVALNPDQIKAVSVADDTRRQFEEKITVTRSVVAERPEKQNDDAKPGKILVDGPLIVELLYPTIVASPNSAATIYAQTSSGRKKFGKEVTGFDITVPGTIKISRLPGDPGRYAVPPGYSDVLVRGNPYAGAALDEGRFTFVVPMEVAPVPDATEAIDDPNQNGFREQPNLAVSGGDEIFVGFQYKDESGAVHWVTRRVTLTSDAFFEAMDRRFQQPVTGLHVGEDLYFRVINKMLDTTDEKDSINVDVSTASGKKVSVPLSETFGHSGIFKGVVKLAFAGESGIPADEVGTIRVTYGDTVTASYSAANLSEPIVRAVQVFKGADGQVVPFTKRFKDPAIAVQTQFTIAEAYFELAKRHRDLGQDDVARKEIAQGKKLLEEAIRDYPETDSRAQADFLLANLSFESAKDAKTDEDKKHFYVEAVTHFSDIVSSYPDSPYAPKSQYKKALVLEQMGQIDQACEEYVKLSYRYPDNELVAETIARLGQYFLTKGKEIEDKVAAQNDVIEREKLKMQGRNMFKTAAQVFGRLAVRFPEHKLAGKTTVLSAQCYMRADDLDTAITVFKSVYEDTKADKDLAAESMYWAGDCNMKKGDLVGAYRNFKKLTWDYPEGKWAKFARGRLTDEKLANISESDSNNN